MLTFDDFLAFAGLDADDAARVAAFLGLTPSALLGAAAPPAAAPRPRRRAVRPFPAPRRR